LFGFLRLLVHHDALARLLSTLDEVFLERTISQISSQVAAAQTAKDERLVNSLQERLTTAQGRLEYARKTRRDADFVKVELDRLEEKIQALSEQAVNQRDPDALSASIDAAAESMQRTQASLADLQNLSGLAVTIADAPAILDADLGSRPAPKIRQP
jgi:chromosome segregation ATPase